MTIPNIALCCTQVDSNEKLSTSQVYCDGFASDIIAIVGMNKRWAGDDQYILDCKQGSKIMILQILLQNLNVCTNEFESNQKSTGTVLIEQNVNCRFPLFRIKYLIILHKIYKKV